MYLRANLSLAAILIGCSVSDASALPIDSFDTAQIVQAPPDSTVSDQVSGAGIAGMERDVVAFAPRGFGATDLEIDLFGSGVLSYSQGWSNAYALLTWDGADDSVILDPLGLGGLDLTDGGLADAFEVDVTFVDSDVLLLVTVHSDAIDSSQATLMIPAGSPPSIFSLVFADFTTLGGSGARFDDVGAIEIRIDGPMGTDLQLESISTAASTPVPEPQTFCLMAAGLIALIAGRRRFPVAAHVVRQRQWAGVASVLDR